MPIIEISHLFMTYSLGDSAVHALNDISMEVGEHEFVAIVGPSGSGKSTLMNIVGCLDIATSGSYKLLGREISSYNDNELSEFRNKTIGFIFQRFNLLNKLTSLENVELPLIYQGVNSRDRRERAITALKTVGLEDRMSHRPMELSGGQQQRVAIARALVTNPPLILADEPTGNLDSKTGSEVISLLCDLNEKGNTIVLITHDMTIANNAKSVYTIRDGKISSSKGGVAK
jgi:putative ABC transport system ATP-binding protein